MCSIVGGARIVVEQLCVVLDRGAGLDRSSCLDGESK